MKTPRLVALVVALALASPAGSPALIADDPGVVLEVVWEQPVDRAAANSALLRAGVTPLATIPQIAVDAVRVPRSQEATAIALLRATPGVSFVGRPAPRYALWTPNDTYVRYQYALDHIRAKRAWDVYPTRRPKRSGPLIAVIDTGITNVRDHHGRIAGGRRFYTDSCSATTWLAQIQATPAAAVNYMTACGSGSYSDSQGHGTGVASVAIARTNNYYGIASVAYTSKVLAMRCNIGSRGQFDMIACAAAIVYAVDKGAKVINMSLGGPIPDPVELRAILYAEAKGVSVIAARGNDGNDARMYPACFPTVIGVTATDTRKKPARFTSYGGTDMCTFVAAPGVAVISANRRGGFSAINGTSIASPQVAAAVALMRGKSPTLDPSRLRDRLKRCSYDLGARGYDDKYGYGLLDVYHLMICR